MHLPVRALRLAFLAPLLFALAPHASGQAAPDPQSYIADRGAWLYKGSDITPDPGWHFGTLTNGLRYAVRRNGVPPGQVSIRVRVDAGSLMETDKERGYAHLIEHLSFRGSEYVPDGEAMRVWQRMGTTFGSDTNAQTTFVSTTFKLDLPSATPQGLDESMKILSGIIEKPNITQAAIAAERPAVLAERREGLGPQQRFGDAMFATLFAGQPLAARQPIGTLDTLNAATPEAVQAFHDRWYRPERVVIVVSGDMDPALFETLVSKHFGDWKGIGSKPAEADFGAPKADAPKTAVTVEAGLPVSLQIATVRPWKYNDDTIIFNQERLTDSIALQVINRKLENHARAGGSYIAAQASLDDIARSVNMTTINVVPVGDDWQSALTDVRRVIADALAAPPTKAEVDQEVASVAEQFRTMQQTAAVDAGSKLADDMVQAVDIRETTTAPVTMNAIFVDAQKKGMFTPARIWASTKRVFNGTATRAVINVHIAQEGLAAKLATALTTDVKADPAKRGKARSVTFADLPKLGKPGAVTGRQGINVYELKLEQVQFANGVRLLMNASSSEAGRVYVRIRFGGGYNALPAAKASPVWAGGMALMAGGIGKLSQNDIEAMTAGRRIGLDFGIDDDAFALSAMTSPADLADQLRLMATKLQYPGWDPAPVARAKTIATTTYDSTSATPDALLGRELEGLLHGGDARWAAPNREQIAATTPETFRALWAPMLASGPIEVDVFGDIDPEATVKAVAETFGALPPRQSAAASNAPVVFPAHNATPEQRFHTGAPDRAIAVIAWPTGGGVLGLTDGRRLDILANVFTNRLFDRLRSEAGASYSPTVVSNWPDGTPAGGRLMAIGQVTPENVPLFYKLSREIAADLVARPVSDDELKRVIGPMAQLMQRQATGNQFWMNQLGGSTYAPAKAASVGHFYQDVVQTSAADLQAIAAKYLDPSKDWTLAIVPKK